MKRLPRHYTLVILFGFFGHLATLPLCHSLYADVPHLIRYQGTAVDSKGVALEGNYDITFRLYDASTSGKEVWKETQPQIPLRSGHFSILLGQISSLSPMDWSQACWLSIQVGAEPELAPRQQITSVPTAIMAEQLAGPIHIAGQNVGIGTTSPGAKMEVLTGAGTTNGIRITEEATNQKQLRLEYDTSAGVDAAKITSITGVGGALRNLIINAGNVGIGTTSPANILTVLRGSATDPIADSWTVYPSDKQHKNIICALNPPQGYLDQLRAVELYAWTRIPFVSDDEAKAALGKDNPTPEEIESKKNELEAQKANLPKFTTKRLGMAIDDTNVPAEVLTFNPDGSKAGIDLLAYIGYLHAALKEAALKIDELEARLDTMASQ